MADNRQLLGYAVPCSFLQLAAASLMAPEQLASCSTCGLCLDAADKVDVRILFLWMYGSSFFRCCVHDHPFRTSPHWTSIYTTEQIQHGTTNSHSNPYDAHAIRNTERCAGAVTTLVPPRRQRCNAAQYASSTNAWKGVTIAVGSEIWFCFSNMRSDTSTGC